MPPPLPLALPTARAWRANPRRGRPTTRSSPRRMRARRSPRPGCVASAAVRATVRARRLVVERGDPASRVGIRVLRHEIVSRTRKSSSLSVRQGGNLASRRNEDLNLRRTIVPRRSSGHMLRPVAGLTARAHARRTRAGRTCEVEPRLGRRSRALFRRTRPGQPRRGGSARPDGLDLVRGDQIAGATGRRVVDLDLDAGAPMRRGTRSRETSDGRTQPRPCRSRPGPSRCSRQAGS